MLKNLLYTLNNIKNTFFLKISKTIWNGRAFAWDVPKNLTCYLPSSHRKSKSKLIIAKDLRYWL